MEAVRVVGPAVHHRDVVVAALDRLEHELKSSPAHAADRLRRNMNA